MKHLAGLVLSLGTVLAPSMLQAQDAWPARPITFVVPYGAGGYTDLVARLTARYVENALGRPVIVDNRAGAGGIVGTQAVANAAGDGYTFCVCSIGAISIGPFDPTQKIGYDPLRDLTPVGIVSSIAQVVIARKDLPVKTLAELVSYAKANPGKLNYGSSGAVEDPGTDHPQVVGDPYQDGRRSRGEGNHAQGWCRHSQDHARAVPCADRPGNCTVEAAGPGDRGEEIAAAELGVRRLALAARTRRRSDRIGCCSLHCMSPVLGT